MPYTITKIDFPFIIIYGRAKKWFQVQLDRHQSSQCVLHGGTLRPDVKSDETIYGDFDPKFPAETIKNVHSIAN